MSPSEILPTVDRLLGGGHVGPSVISVSVFPHLVIGSPTVSAPVTLLVATRLLETVKNPEYDHPPKIRPRR